MSNSGNARLSARILIRARSTGSHSPGSCSPIQVRVSSLGEILVPVLK